MHYRPHLRPHHSLHGHLGLVVLRARLRPAGLFLCVCRAESNGSRVRSGVSGILAVRVGISLRVLPCGAAEGDGGNAADKVAGLLLDGLPLVVLRGAGGAIVTSQDPRLGLLDAACAAVHQSDGGGREEVISRGRVDDEGNNNRNQGGYDKVEEPRNKISTGKGRGASSFSP